MNKKTLIKILKELNLKEGEYYILSSGSMMMHGLRDSIEDIDLCVSEELFLDLKRKYNIDLNSKNDCGFYKVNEYLEVVPNKKEDMKYDVKDGIYTERLTTILDFKVKRNAPKDKEDIIKIKNYLKSLKNGKK